MRWSVVGRSGGAALLMLLSGTLGGCAAAPPGDAAKASAAPVSKGVPPPPARAATAAAGDKALAGHIQLGLGYLSQNDRKSARYHLLKALAIDSRSAGAHHGMALLFQVEKEDAQAEVHFRKAIALDGRFTRARNNFGVFLYSRDRFAEAYEQFAEAAQDLNYEQRPGVYLNLGLTAVELDRGAEAEAAFSKALDLDPRVAGPYLELAVLAFASGDYAAAKTHLANHLRLARPSARSLWLDIRLAHALGEPDVEASKALALKKIFPMARESELYDEWVRNGRP